MSESEKNSSSSAFIRLLGYARPYRKRMIGGIAAGILVGGSVFGLLSNLQGLFQPITGQSAPVAEERAHNNTLGSGGAFLERLGIPTVTDEGRMTWQLMVLSVIGLPLFVTLRAGATFVNRYFMRWVGARVVADIRNKMFEHLQAQSLAFFGKSDVGKLISRVTNDTGQVENLLATTVSDATRAPFEILSAATFAIMFAHRNGLLPLLLCVFLVFPLCVLPIAVLGRRVKRHTAEALSRISVVVSRMHENFTGIRVVKAFDMEREEQERFASINSGYFRSSIRALRAELLMTPLMEAVAILLSMVFIVICYVRGVGMSLVLPVSVACVVAYKPVKQLARVNADLQRAAASLGRIFELLDEDTQLSISPHAVDVREFKDSVVFDHVSFRYDVDGGEALSGIDLTIRRGDIIAFVGETGSGKTTVANLLARFYDPSQGSVCLDGIDLREINPRSLRRLIGVVTQETILFNDTIAANISYGAAGATRELIETAARQANAHEFIIGNPLGYDRVVGEKGFVLSGGERQRIAIARAILKNPPILILDEATSALDTVTERLVQEAISRVMENRTVFAIAHRLSTIRHASHICLLDNGRIVERGTHDELYAAEGRYRNLCDIQFNE